MNYNNHSILLNLEEFKMQKKGWVYLVFFVLYLIITVILFKASILYGFLFIFGSIVALLFFKRAAVLALIGRTIYFRGNIDKSIIWFKRAYKTDVAKPKTTISYAYLLLKSGNIKDSEKILKKLLESQLETEDHMLAKSNMALINWKKGELNIAIETLEEILKSFETTNIYGSLGYMLIQQGDLDKALEFNLNAREYNESNPIILDNLGQTYYLRKEHDKAFEIYEKLIDTKPTFPEPYYNYSLVLKEKGENLKALEMAEKASGLKISFLSTINKEDIAILVSSLK